MPEFTVRESMDVYLESIASTKSQSTAQAYRVALKKFMGSVQEQGIDIDSVSASQTSGEWLVSFFKNLEGFSASTEGIYHAGIVGWYRFLVSNGTATIDLDRLRRKIRPHRQTRVRRLVHPPDRYSISRVVDYAAGLIDIQPSHEYERLILLRNRALILTLADTEIDVNTVCTLRLGDIDWRNHRFVVGSKRDGQRFVSFTPRVSAALLDYLNARKPYDKAASHSQSSLPVLARHRLNEGGRVLPLMHRGITNAVASIAREALGLEYDGTITPKSFRHFSTDPLVELFASLHPKISGKCQILFENGQYDDAIFNAMKVIEEEVRSRISADPTDYGVELMSMAMRPESSLISFSSIEAEQQAAHLLYRGAIGFFKNPHSHRFVGVSEPMRAFECLAMASLLMRMLDEAT